MDQQGNLYGTTEAGPTIENAGTVYELQPLGGSWTYSILAALPGGEEMNGPEDAPFMDAAGNLYATSSGGGSSTYGTSLTWRPRAVVGPIPTFTTSTAVMELIRPAAWYSMYTAICMARLLLRFRRIMAKFGSSRRRRPGTTYRLGAWLSKNRVAVDKVPSMPETAEIG